MVEMARFIKPILAITPPDLTSMDPRPLMPLAGLARRFQQLPQRQQAVFVQLMTMSASEFLDQWFETDPLKATMSASGIIGTYQGVKSPGTAYVLLHHYMGEIDGAFRAWGIPKGGTGGVSNAIGSAAKALGAEIRTNAPVANVIVKGGRAVGVALESGEEIHADSILSSLDSRQTFLNLLEPGSLDPSFEAEVRRFKFRGSSGKVNLAVDRLPEFTSLPGVGEHLRGAISFSPSIEDMETRLRRREVRPLQPEAVHRHDHPDPGRPVDGAARQARHQLLRPVRAVQARARARDLGRPARGVRRRGHRPDRRVRPEHPRHHPPPQRPDPARHRAHDRACPRATSSRASCRSSSSSSTGRCPATRASRHRSATCGCAGRRPTRAAGSWAPTAGSPRSRSCGPAAGRRPSVAGASETNRTTRSSSAAATTAWWRRPTSARPGCGRSSSSDARPWAGPPRPPSSRRAPACRRWPTRSGGCGRRSSATSICKRHGLSLVGPEVRAFAPGPDGDAIVLWGDVARTAEGLRARSAADADAYAAVRPPRPRAVGLPRRDRRPDAARHRVARSRRRPRRPPARADVPRPRAATTAGRSPASCRWRSPISWPSRSRPMRSRRRSPGAASSTPRWGRGRRARPPSCSPTRPATTAERPGQTVFARGGPGALAAALEAAAREAGVEIRTGAEVTRDHIA